MSRTNTSLLVSAVCALLVGCPTSNEPMVANPRPAEVCVHPRSGPPPLSVYQSTEDGCAILIVRPLWDESTPPEQFEEGRFLEESGVEDGTRVSFTRESCERAYAVGRGEGGVETRELRSMSGFVTSTLVEPGSPTTTAEVLLSASLDFTVDGVEATQTVRILNLPATRRSDVCPAF